MDAPLCKICHTRHFGTEAHKFDSTAKSDRPARKKKSKKIRGGISGEGAGPKGGIDLRFALSGGNAAGLELLDQILARVESLEAGVLQLESRKKYTRELMRERRKAGKA